MSGKRYYVENDNKLKIIAYISAIVLLITAIALVFVLSLYQSKTEADKKIASQNNVEQEIVTQTESTDDKTINDVENITSNYENTTNVDTSNEIKQEVKQASKKEKKEEKKDVKKELKFEAPLEGEIVKDYADTNLVYSDTLKEWVTHFGIDIEAEEGSAVSASEDGVVKSIKEDPRYGLTVTIDHGQGFETVYSNLLSAEFVAEKDTVKKGQTIGTVGSSAPFEIVDSSHLHFEMFLNNSNVNPTTYWK